MTDELWCPVCDRRATATTDGTVRAHRARVGFAALCEGTGLLPSTTHGPRLPVFEPPRVIEVRPEPEPEPEPKPPVRRRWRHVPRPSRFHRCPACGYLVALATKTGTYLPHYPPGGRGTWCRMSDRAPSDLVPPEDGWLQVLARHADQVATLSGMLDGTR